MLATRIALDVMGGDNAPDAPLLGARMACSGSPMSSPGRSPSGGSPSGSNGGARIPPERILLVGDERVIQERLAATGGDPGFGILHASEVIGMGESPATALRSKPDNSISVAVGSVKHGRAGAMVSMGNTGAVVGASTLVLGTLPGVKRPGIAVTLELTGHPLTLIDMGANIAPKPEHLVQYAVMGSVYVRDCLGEKEPRVGLLNIGEEENKGTELLKEAYKALASAPIRFIGNLEGGDIFQDKAEVVVTDGFTGNVVLKLLEHFAGFMLGLTLAELGQSGTRVPPDALARIRRHIDYSEYGGALLVGLSGIVVKGHGRSDENAVANAIRLAARALDSGVNQHIVQGFERAAGEPSPAREGSAG